jgi:hypothetical protein
LFINGMGAAASVTSFAGVRAHSLEIEPEELVMFITVLPRPAQNVSAPTQLLVDDGHWNGMPD